MDSLFGPHRKQLLPQDDPFYGYHRTEADLKQHSPGTILATRSIRMKPWFGLNVDQLLVWEIAYVTTGPKGAEVTVCTVVVPPNAGERAKVVVQCPKTDSAAPICRTSYALREGNGGATDGASEQIFMAPFLDRGYIVVLPDYEGQRDAFGCGSISGQSTLDAIRATLACADLKLAPKDKMRFVVWGYSGGAIASVRVGGCDGSLVAGYSSADSRFEPLVLGGAIIGNVCTGAAAYHCWFQHGRRAS